MAKAKKLMEDLEPTTTQEVSLDQEEVQETPLQDSDEQVEPVTELPARADTGDISSNFWSEDDDWAATVIGTTRTGKSVQVVKRPDGLGYRVNFREGGPTPPEFEGWFTSYDKAANAAKIYLNRRLESA